MKKWILALLMAGLLAMPAYQGIAQEAIAVDAPYQDPSQSPYASVQGKVTQVQDYIGADGQAVDGMKLISLVDQDGSPATLMVTPGTHIMSDTPLNAIKVGDSVIAFYDARGPMILIYPPQYTPVAMVVNLPAGQSVKLDMFDEQLLSADGQLKLNMGPNTQIVNTDGSHYEGMPSNQTLFVWYTFSTFSIPAQTTPEKVVVMPDLTPMATLNEIRVEGQFISAPPAFFGDNGIVMVPLGPIAKALGYGVTFDPATCLVTVGYQASFTLGQDAYAYARRAPQSLGAAAVGIDGEIYVPLKFFSQVLPLNNAYVLEGQVVIDNGEKME